MVLVLAESSWVGLSRVDQWWEEKEISFRKTISLLGAGGEGMGGAYPGRSSSVGTDERETHTTGSSTPVASCEDATGRGLSLLFSLTQPQ